MGGQALEVKNRVCGVIGQTLHRLWNEWTGSGGQNEPVSAVTLTPHLERVVPHKFCFSSNDVYSSPLERCWAVLRLNPGNDGFNLGFDRLPIGLTPALETVTRSAAGAPHLSSDA